MNIVFIGASGFGLRCLRLVKELGVGNLAGVVTAPQEFNISYSASPVKNYLHADFKEYCASQSIPCVEMCNGMNDTALFEDVCSWRPDIFLVVGWYHMVPAKWRQIAPAYGLHASLLPDYSGGAPLVWAMINSEPKTGITFFQFDDGVDSGPIVGSADTDILADDTIKTLYDRIEGLGVSLIERHLPDLVDGSAILKAQNENNRRVFPQRSPEDGLIDWHQPATKIYDFVRAQTKPYPGAFTMNGKEKIIIWGVTLTDKISSLPMGTFYQENGQEYVVCGDGFSIKLQDVERRPV